MKVLSSNQFKLPDVIFLDMNMPRKNGNECLLEIKRNEQLNHIPVIIYSTALYDGIANSLYENGAHYYLKKCEFRLLTNGIQKVLNLLKEDSNQPPRNKFIIPCSEMPTNGIYLY